VWRTESAEWMADMDVSYTPGNANICCYDSNIKTFTTILPHRKDTGPVLKVTHSQMR
jgi:hypothetical protein